MSPFMSLCKNCGKKKFFLKLNSEGLCDKCNTQLIKSLKDKIEELYSPEYQDLESIKKSISKCKQTVQDLDDKVIEIKKDIACKRDIQRELENQIIILDDEVLVQSFGLYTPKYDFSNSTQYKEQLTLVRQKQKDMIKLNKAVLGSRDWTLNGDPVQGQKMIKDMQKLLLRAFNSECDELIGKVKYNNRNAIEKRIRASMDAVSRLGKIMGIFIAHPYYLLKIDELNLAFEYRQKKQQEKEDLRRLREQMREEAKLQRDLEEERKKLEKEHSHYKNALYRLEQQLAKNPENKNLLQKKQDLHFNLMEIQKAIENVDYRKANKKAGYVYIISNIGAFGENVYKIGMTRRLDPTERVDELGDASVPFNFDIHAMIFSENAPALEAALHQAFSDRKLNMVNTRREFFYVTLDEIKDVVSKNFDKTVDFIDVPDAEQFRVSQKIHKQTT